MKKVKDIFVSVAALVFPEHRDVGIRLSEIEKVLKDNYAHYEILVLDTPDCLGMNQDMDEVLKRIPKIRYIRMFNHASLRVLTAAGMENAIGDVIVTANLEYLIGKNITGAVECCCEGNDVVNGVCSYKKPCLYNLGSSLFRFLCGRMIRYNLPKKDTFFRCVSRRIVTASLNSSNFSRFVFLALSHSGGKTYDLEIDVPLKTYRKYAVQNNFSQALSLLIFNTTTPLRLANAVALGASSLSMFFALYSIVIRLLKSHVVEGWTTLMLVITILFSCLFVILAFLGEYLVRLVHEHARSSEYQVVFEKHSSVMLDLKELNIRDDSVSDEINKVQTGRDR